MIVCGVDPGLSGGVAILTPSFTKSGGVEVDLMVMPEIQAFVAKMQWLAAAEDECHVFVEKAQSMPTNKASAMFNYGTGYGQLLGVLWCLGIAHSLVGPRVWTKAMWAGTKDAEPKKRSLEAVQRLFPNIKLTATARCKVPHLGLVDALLIAEHGRRTLRA